jgi:hypothetical protein
MSEGPSSLVLTKPEILGMDYVEPEVELEEAIKKIK